jgi:hypothetical protein
MQTRVQPVHLWQACRHADRCTTQCKHIAGHSDRWCTESVNKVHLVTEFRPRKRFKNWACSSYMCMLSYPMILSYITIHMDSSVTHVDAENHAIAQKSSQCVSKHWDTHPREPWQPPARWTPAGCAPARTRAAG